MICSIVSQGFRQIIKFKTSSTNGYPLDNTLVTARVTIPAKTRGPQLPKILHKIVQSLKFSKDCKIVTSPKHLLLHVWSRDCRSFRTLMHENLRRNFRKYTKIYREMVFKDCEAERDCKVLVKISSRL